MEIDTEDAITKDIISMAHRLGHKVVAEGIEFEKQKKYLEDSDCDKIQGYLIAKSLNVLDAKNILKKSMVFKKPLTLDIQRNILIYIIYAQCRRNI